MHTAAICCCVLAGNAIVVGWRRVSLPCMLVHAECCASNVPLAWECSSWCRCCCFLPCEHCRATYTHIVSMLLPTHAWPLVCRCPENTRDQGHDNAGAAAPSTLCHHRPAAHVHARVLCVDIMLAISTGSVSRLLSLLLSFHHSIGRRRCNYER